MSGLFIVVILPELLKLTVKVTIFVQMLNVKTLRIPYSNDKIKNGTWIFLIVLVVLLIRRYDAFANPQFFAEDGNVYFIQYVQYGIKSLLIPYGGYLHFVPRLVVIFWGILHVNYLYIPACYCFSELLITFLIAYSLWNTSSYLNIKHRIAYAVSFLFLPIASDIFMNLTNINWIVSLYLINFLFVRQTDYTNKSNYLNLFAITIISLSGPFSTLLIPLVLAVIVLERKELSFRKMAPLLLILVGGIIQLICIEFIDPGFYRGIQATPEPYHLLKLITNNVNEYLFLGRLDKWLSPSWITFISFLIFLALFYLFIVAYIKIKNKRRYLLLWYAIIVLISFVKAYWPNESHLLATCNARYYFLPFTCVCWLVILSLDKKIKPVYLITYVLIFFTLSKHIQLVLPDKHWKKEIREYYNGTRQEIDINPDGWQFTLPKGNKNKVN